MNLSSPHRFPLGILIKIGGRWEEGKTWLLLFSLPIVPRALSFFLSPASLRYKEASAEARENELFLRMYECSIFRMHSNANLIEMDCRSVILKDRFVILARKVYICSRFFA